MLVSVVQPGISVRHSDAVGLADDELVALALLDDEEFTETWGHRSHTPPAVAMASYRTRASQVRRVVCTVHSSDGSLAGRARLSVEEDRGDNPDVADCELYVAPAHRNAGVGHALLDAVTREARRLGATRLLGRTDDRASVGARFASSVGAEAKFTGRVSRLRVTEIDADEMQRWVADGPRRARGYDLMGWDGPVPDEILDSWVELAAVMNTAPLEDIELNDRSYSAERIRELDQRHHAAGVVMWTVAARARATGALVGYHNVKWPSTSPTLLFVEDTGVQPAHRGHALGKWLKATLALRLIAERPGVVDVFTANAESNEAMLGINNAMGYRPFFHYKLWELPVR